MIIGLVGYGFTGKSAIMCLLKEFEECSFCPYTCEFILPYIQHGIQDLEYQLMVRPTRFFSSDAAIKDFKRMVRLLDTPHSAFRKTSGNKLRELTDRFAEEITQIEYKGYTYEDMFLASRFYRLLRFSLFGRVVNLSEKVFPSNTVSKYLFSHTPEKIYLSLYPENFHEAVKKYLRDVMLSLQYDLNKKVVLDQPFDASNPENSMKYFDDPKAIIVDRDPRDIYVLAKKFWQTQGNFIPSDTVENYISYHRLIRKHPEGMKSDRVLRIQYEDLIYNYDATVKTVTEFLDLDVDHWAPKKYFDPQVSIENTQVFRRFASGLEDDIKKIEKELPEYLYQFEKYEQHAQGKRKPF